MGNIVLLDELTINKIAAGEVIERPASVVKELVENSIDAGANKITVEIQNGGIKKIKIIDNGCGITKDDMEFAFERHATSKIRNAEDLEKVKSMGFRGEALASIAAIANVKMISRVATEESGNLIVVEGGKILENEEIAAGVGTTITVTNLFFNTPVRYKFLKKDFTEAGYIEDMVTRIALANPNISIKLINGNKTIIQTNGNGSLKDAIYCIYGKDVAEGIINVSYQYEDVKVEGAIGKPEIARGNRSYQQFFVNKRFIKDKTLSSAAEQAYKGLLTIGKYGFLVLNIEIEPQKIDVNVHPTKLEIRWSEEQKVFKAVYHTIREGLLKEDLIKDSNKEQEYYENDRILENKETNSNYENNTNIKINEEDKFKTSSFMNLFRRREDDKSNFIENNSENTIQELFNRRNEREEIKLNLQKEDSETNLTEEQKEFDGTKEVPTEEQKEFDGTKEVPTEEQKEFDGTKEISTEEQKEFDGTKEIPTEEQKEFDGTKEIQTEEQREFKIPTEEQIDKITNILNLQKNMEIKKEQSDNDNFKEMYEKTFGKSLRESIDKIAENNNALKADLHSAKNISVFEENEVYNRIPEYKYIGSFFSTYIVIEMGEEIYIIDQHAAHERVMYEKIKKNFYSENEKESQIMLLPDIINLTHKEKDIVKENTSLFKKAGFILEEFGENTIRLIGVPSSCMDLDTKELFIQLLDEIDTVAITATQEKEDKFISTIACKAAVKARMKLDKEEVDNLMKELLLLKNPFTCPHGRPTAIKMTKKELDKKFERT